MEAQPPGLCREGGARRGGSLDGWICWEVLLQSQPGSAVAAAKTGMSLMQRPQVAKLPEGHEEETPTSAPLKAQTFRWPRREGSWKASSRVGFHLNTQLQLHAKHVS